MYVYYDGNMHEVRDFIPRVGTEIQTWAALLQMSNDFDDSERSKRSGEPRK